MYFYACVATQCIVRQKTDSICNNYFTKTDRCYTIYTVRRMSNLCQRKSYSESKNKCKVQYSNSGKNTTRINQRHSSLGHVRHCMGRFMSELASEVKSSADIN